jgi:hypothetical protein
METRAEIPEPESPGSKDREIPLYRQGIILWETGRISPMMIMTAAGNERRKCHGHQGKRQ